MGRALVIEIEKPDLRNHLTIKQMEDAGLIGGEYLPSEACTKGRPCTFLDITPAGLITVGNPFYQALAERDEFRAADRALGRCKNKLTDKIEPLPHPQIGRWIKVQMSSILAKVEKVRAAGWTYHQDIGVWRDEATEDEIKDEIKDHMVRSHCTVISTCPPRALALR